MKGHIVFLGGIFLDEKIAEIEKKSIGVVQNAADVFQKGFLRGISRVFTGKLTLVNIPFVNSYPRGYRDIYYCSAKDSSFENFRVINKGWFNFEFVRTFFRFKAAFSGLKTALCGKSGIVIIYSANLPFLAASFIYALIYRGTKTCLILPDFPEFMGGGGWLKNKLKLIESYIFYSLVKHIDFFVLITPFMAERLGVESSRFCIVEGITDLDAKLQSHSYLMPKSDRRIFLYTGTLAKRYGICDLLSAFSRLNNMDVELWICGDGDSRAAVQEFAASDKRVIYLGQLPRNQAVQLQQRAHVLVNPRLPNDDYTKYSFPSKTIEYLAAGRPVIMHKLPGMPAEYLPYIIVPDTADVAGLYSALKSAVEMPIDGLRVMGESGRDFVFTHKSPEKQCEKITNMIFAN